MKCFYQQKCLTNLQVIFDNQQKKKPVLLDVWVFDDDDAAD